MTDQIEHRRGYHTKDIEDIFYKITEKKNPQISRKRFTSRLKRLIEHQRDRERK